MKEKILDYIKQNHGAEIPALQKKFGITYREMRKIVDELIANGTLVYESGVKFNYVDKAGDNLSEKIADLERCRKELLQKMYEIDAQKETDDKKSPQEKYNAYFEARRKELMKRLQADLDDEEDDDESDGDEDFAAFEKYMRAHLGDDDGDGKKNRENDQFINLSLKNNNTVGSGEEEPVHSSWENEEEFDLTVMDHLERLIRSDRLMGRQRALKIAEANLEAVKETGDTKIIRVYEQICYEIGNTNDYYYRQLKKQIFGD